ncbi:cytochrome P450 52A12 [Rhizodiscina lignyota]|uniref:Cytochrome P450 52A12 n=1 Tax=Rhizodiscina lignyota TaxID=1504668 RepID=A0A9P4M4S2_9PEZI|nr:cytochrome P450 52A12 [Rhizodiscina lignyota]
MAITDAIRLTPTTLAGVFGVALLLYTIYSRITLRLSRQKVMRENGCQPLVHKIPLKDPFLGIDLIMENAKAAKETRLLENGQARFHKYGRTYKSKLADNDMIITMEPENIKTVLSLKFKDYVLTNRMRLLGRLLGPGIFTSDGEAWQHSRGLLRPNFARDQLADIEAFEGHIQYMFKAIPTDGRTVDLQELFFRLTIDSATEFLFGESVHSLRMTSDKGGPDESNFTWAFTYAQDAAVKRSRWGKLGIFFSNKDEDEACRMCHEFVDRFVDKAVRYREQEDLEKGSGEKPSDKHYIFLYELAKATKDKAQLRSEMMNILLAGRDTTASLLSNMFFMIAKNPQIWERLQREVQDTLHGELPTYEQLRNMKYLKYCLNESLRIHPVVPANSRRAIRDTIIPLGGGPDGRSPLLVEKGTVVGYSPWSMHRDERWYGPDAAEYRPERWENLRPGWEYLPFNGGPRICLGQQYALTEASYTTVRICQQFSKLESRDDGPWREGLTLTMCSKNGCHVALSP